MNNINESPMDHPQFSGQPTNGLTYLILCGLCSIFSWLNVENIDLLFTWATKLVSIGAGVMAFRHYLKQNPFLKKTDK
jgi:hypothetical protein